MRLIFIIVYLLLSYSTVQAVETFPDPVYFNSQLVIPRLPTDPVSASANAGSIWFNRADQKFKGDNGSIVVEFGAGGGAPGSTPHNILSPSHTDTSGAATGGAILRYVPGVNTWQPLAKGTANQFLGMTSSAGDLVYRSLLGTGNQVVVTQNAGNITLSLPQNLNVGANLSLGAVAIVDLAISTSATLRGAQLVTLNEAQTISNKSINTSVINNPTINSTTIQGVISVGSGLNFSGNVGFSNGVNIGAALGVGGNITSSSNITAGININAGGTISATGGFIGNASTTTQFASAPTPCPPGQYARGINVFGNSTPCENAAEYLWGSSGPGINTGAVVAIGTTPSLSFSLQTVSHINNGGSYYQGGNQGITLNPAGRFNSGGCVQPAQYVQSFIVTGGIITGINMATCPSTPGPGD